MTSPLNFSKREREQRLPPLPIIPRRTSSSYKHVRSNNLVSKSPFKSSIPTPTHPPLSPMRRVSAEKRPRPSSMHEQAENERPFGLKRERKQSSVFQGLLQTEPVTKSPFRKLEHSTPSINRTPIPQPPFSPSKLPNTMTTTNITPMVTSSNTNSPSPTRPSLVSRRLHGPRVSGGGRRGRRKTVTWDERCDVVEFDRDPTSDEDVFIDAEQEGNNEDQAEYEDTHDEDMQDEILSLDHQDNLFFQTPPALTYGSDSSQEFDLDPDVSITGIVESMLARATTPERDDSLPPDTETEGGVPLGRTHHAERNAERAAVTHPPSPQLSPLSRPQYNANNPSTPPHQALSSPPSTPPLGRTTHAERAHAAREGEREGEEALGMLPPSPSPMKKHGTLEVDKDMGLIPKLDLSGISDKLTPTIDSFASFCSELEGEDEDINSDISYSSCHEEDSISNTSITAVPPPLHQAGTSTPPLRLSRSATASPLSPGRQRQDSPLTSRVSSRNCTPSFGSSRPMVSPPPGSRARSSGAGAELHNAHSPLRHLPQHMSTASSPSSPLALAGSPRSRIQSASPSALYSDSPSGRRRLDRDQTKKRLLRRHTQEDLSWRSSSSAAVEAEPKAAEATFSLDVSGDVFDQNDDILSSSLPYDSSKIDSDVVNEVVNATIERVVVEKLAFGTAAMSAADMDMQPHNEAEEEGDISTNSVAEAPITLDELSPPKPPADEVTQAEDALTDDEEKPAEHMLTESTFSGLEIDFGGRFGHGLGTVLEGSRSTKASVGDIDVDMEMRSALDRLMEDVAGTNDPVEIVQKDTASAKGKQRVEAVAGFDAFKSPPISRNVSNTSVSLMPVPPVPPKDDMRIRDNRRMREELILQKRREARMMDEQQDVEYSIPARHAPSAAHLGVGRPSRRRSMSTGDAEELGRRASASSGGLLGKPSFKDDDELTDSINKELRKLEGQPSKESSRYQIREREGLIYASSDSERVSHVGNAGDVNAGKAWRPVRRPSDMNEYSKQIRELRAMEKPGKAHGKVFVRVIGVKNLDIPLPSQLTLMTCTLNNGIHYVTTPECQLQRDARVEQEFELIEHSKLEFTLTLKVKRDPHIITQFKSMAPTPVAAPIPPPVAAPSSSRGGMFNFFSSSPKKSKEKLNLHNVPRPASSEQPRAQLHENLARYLKPDGTLARAFISFKEIANRCDTRLFETTYPLIGQKLEQGNRVSSRQIGEIVLQIFRLPPLPGISQDKLPQSLEECHRGLRHVNWHKVTYFEGTLTQNGGDCTSWRRRQMRVIGANLVAFNDVTKRATATIDLRKAVAVEDDQPHTGVTSPLSTTTGKSTRSMDEYESLYGVERSFRLIFQDNQEIVFFADTDDEKSRWLEVLRALIGRIPPNPFWAEMLWQRQAELNKQKVVGTVPSRQQPTQGQSNQPMAAR